MKIFDKSELPNIEGFMFMSIYFDGHEEIAEVKKNSFGIHFIDDYLLISSWRRLSFDEKIKYEENVFYR